MFVNCVICCETVQSINEMRESINDDDDDDDDDDVNNE
jgi:hypothetical protein